MNTVDMTSPLQTTAEVAAEFNVSAKKVSELARTLGIGSNFGGRAGYRFTAADKSALLEALRPAIPVARRRRRAS